MIHTIKSYEPDGYSIRTLDLTDTENINKRTKLSYMRAFFRQFAEARIARDRWGSKFYAILDHDGATIYDGLTNVARFTAKV